MSRSLPNPGTYPGCKKCGSIVVAPAETGALCVYIPVTLPEGSPVMWQGKHTMTIVKSDGELQQRRISDLRKIFGWQTANPFDLQGIDPNNECLFELVLSHKEWTPKGEGAVPQTVVEIEWMNPPGGSSNMPSALSEADQKKVMAAHLSKFKALLGSSGTTAAKPAATAKAEPKPAAKPAVAPPGPPGPKKSNATHASVRTCTQEEAWNSLVEKNGGQETADVEALGTEFWTAVEAVTGKNPAELNIAEIGIQVWGEVADKLGV